MGYRADQRQTKVPMIMAGIVVLLVAIIVQTPPVSGQINNNSGRIYGNWQTRHIQRKCKHELYCRYKENDCMNYNNQNTWVCNEINTDIEANNCLMKMCDGEQGMICDSTPPSDEYMMVESDSCATGLQCYMKRPPVTTTILPPLRTTTSSGLLPPAGGPVVQITTTSSGLLPPAGGPVVQITTTPSLLNLILTTTRATTTTTDGGLLNIDIL